MNITSKYLNLRGFFIFLVSLILLLFISACADSSKDDSSVAASIDEETAQGFASSCGVIEDDKPREIPSRADIVDVEVIGTDALIITRRDGPEAGNKQLVKLHAISSSGINSFRLLHGIDIMKRRLAGGAYFVPAGRNCGVVLPGGGEGILGQVYSINGESMSELMLKQGSAMPSDDICNGATLFACYSTIPLTPRQPSEIELDVQNVNLSSQCGTVRNGNLENPSTRAELVRVIATSSTQVVITRLLGLEAGNPQIVKLHGLSAVGLSNTANRLGVNYIAANAAPEAYVVIESQECEVEIDGTGIGVVGQLFTKSGQSINEELIRQGYARSTNDTCRGNLISACYNEIAASAPVIEDPVAPPPGVPAGGGSGGGFNEGVISWFLWKPVSESNGNVVVLVNPRNVRVEVTGAVNETLVDSGPSNERGTTARGRRTGCAYGGNITVSFFNVLGQAIPVAGGGTTVNIPNGCNRVEFRR